MKHSVQISISSLVPALLFLAAQQHAFAGSATWATNPTTSDWNTAQNWMPNTVPDGPTDTATFTTSNITQLTDFAVTEVAALNFNSGASSFTITSKPGTAFIISGAGISNASGKIQTFLSEVDGGFGAGFFFENGATAGEGTIFTGGGATISFSGSATADHAMITLALGPGFSPGQLTFFDNASAGEATVETDDGGETIFDGNSTAANATFNTVADLSSSASPARRRTAL